MDLARATPLRSERSGLERGFQEQKRGVGMPPLAAPKRNHSRPKGAPVLLLLTAAATLLVWPSGLAEAQTVSPTPVEEETVRTSAPRLFERRVIFTTGYLARALEMAQRRPATTPSLDVANDAPPANAAYRPESYARRYNISRELASTIIDTAVEEGIDPELGFRLVRVESLFRPNARGPGGSLGLTQLMPSTARAVDRSLRTEADILDPATNLRVGFRYLRRMIERYDGDVRLGVLAYNRGSQAIDRALTSGRDPENGYSSKVLGSPGSRYVGDGLLGPD